MVTGTLDDGDGTRVTHGEALTDLTIDIQLTRRGAIEARVAGDDVVFGIEVAADRRQDGDAATRQTFGEVVVGLALELEVDAVNKEGAEALTGRTFEANVDGVVGQTLLTVFRGDDAREHTADGAVGVADGEVEVDLLLVGD